MNKGNCVLIGAGDLTISEIPVGENDLCIAVDGGYEYCKLLEITPDYILGDFDSLGEKEAENVVEIAKTEKEKVVVYTISRTQDQAEWIIRLSVDTELNILTEATLVLLIYHVSRHLAHFVFQKFVISFL